MSDGIVRSGLFWLKILEFVFGAVTFSVATFFEPELLVLPSGGMSKYSRITYLQDHVMAIATSGYPLIVVPSILIGYFVHGRKALDRNIVCGLLSACGFIVYLVTASIIVSKIDWKFDDTNYEATGVSTTAFITGFLYLIDTFIFFMGFFTGKKPLNTTNYNIF